MARLTVPCTASLLLLTILIITLVSISLQVKGQKTVVPNVQTNPEVQDIGKSCIEQYNKMEIDPAKNIPMDIPVDPIKNVPLTFKQVVEATVETVSGFRKYTLKINTAFQDGTPVSFDCVAAVHPGEKTGALVSWSLKTI